MIIKNQINTPITGINTTNALTDGTRNNLLALIIFFSPELFFSNRQMQQLSPRDSQNLVACNYHDCFYHELLVQTLLQLHLNPVLSIFFTVHHWFLIWTVIEFANYSWKKTRNSFAVFLYCVCVHEITSL